MTTKQQGSWQGVGNVSSYRFTCGHCGADIHSAKAYYTSNGTPHGHIYICHNCNKPTYVNRSTKEQVPGALLGGNIEHLPGDIKYLYEEIRRSTTVGSYTAAVLAARKLLMHIAVECGASSGKKFQIYVDYLVDNHYAPPNSKGWVDRIREVGNEANHEISIMDEEDAKSIIKFIEMLLKFNYEFPKEGVTESENVGSPTPSVGT